MKACYAVSALLLAAIALVACGGGGTSAPIVGNWSITLTTQAANPPGTEFSPGVFIMTLVPGSCAVTSGTKGTITAKGSSCSYADNTGESSLSGTGTFFGHPEKVVIGASGAGQYNVLFLEQPVNCCSSMILYDGKGTMSNGVISGMWTCYDDPANACSPGDLFGTFTGSKQQ